MRLKALTNQQFELLIESVAIRYRVKCDEINSTLIRQTLQAEFSKMFVNDFNEAFIKHCSGKFMISKEAEGNKPYGDLSCLFICDVIKAFNIWRQGENAKPKPIPVSHQIDMPEENKKDAYDFIKGVKDKTGELPIYGNWNDAYLFMEEAGLITINDDEKRMFSNLVYEDIKEELAILKRERSNGYGDLLRITQSKKLYSGELRKRYLHKFFE